MADIYPAVLESRNSGERYTMSEKCEHNTTIVKYDQGNVQVEVCTWGCGQTIISVKRADAVTESFTASELSALRAEVERSREIIADANELLWEFTENPNIEMGEVGHQKIEDYFKKYAPSEGQKRE